MEKTRKYELELTERQLDVLRQALGELALNTQDRARRAGAERDQDTAKRDDELLSDVVDCENALLIAELQAS